MVHYLQVTRVDYNDVQYLIFDGDNDKKGTPGKLTKQAFLDHLRQDSQLIPLREDSIFVAYTKVTNSPWGSIEARELQDLLCAAFKERCARLVGFVNIVADLNPKCLNIVVQNKINRANVDFNININITFNDRDYIIEFIWTRYNKENSYKDSVQYQRNENIEKKVEWYNLFTYVSYQLRELVWNGELSKY